MGSRDGPEHGGDDPADLREQPAPRSNVALRTCASSCRRQVGPERTEVACERALRFGARSYKPIERMLKQQLDLRPHPDDDETAVEPIRHDQVRGPGYSLN